MIGGACMNGAFGQKAYTLDECIQAALTNNVRMKNANNELEMAKQDKKKAFTNYFPSVSAAGTGFMADKGLMQMSLGPDMNMSMLKNGIAGGVGASLPLFTGGQIVNGNQLAKVGVEVKRLQRNLSDNEVCLTTEQYFWRVVILKEKLKTLSKVEAQLARILSDVEASVQAGIEKGMIVLVFIDQGIPYNPLENKDPDITLNLEEREIGGLGIYMVKKIMDEVSYEYMDGQNILRMRKSLSSR